MSGDPKQEYFSDGLTESIIDSVAQMRGLRVIARNSSFRYKGQAVDVRKVGEELGADYLVEGSVRRSGDMVRVTAQLVETASGSHRWSKTYDRALTAKNLFAIQDEIAAAITTHVGGFYGVIGQEGVNAAKRKPPGDLTSYDCAFLLMDYSRAPSLLAMRAARDCAEKQVKLDPDYAPLWNVLTIVYLAEYQFGYDPRPGSLERSVDAARRALRLAPNEAAYHGGLARALFFQGDLEGFKTEADRALELSPKGHSIFGILGIYYMYVGQWEKGLALIEQAKVLDPYFPGWYHLGAFHHHFRQQQYAEALEDAKRIQLPDFVQGLSVIVAAYGQLGRAAEAQPYVKRIYEMAPNFDAREHWTARFPFQPDYLERLLEAMRRGGLKVSEKAG